MEKKIIRRLTFPSSCVLLGKTFTYLRWLGIFTKIKLTRQLTRLKENNTPRVFCARDYFFEVASKNELIKRGFTKPQRGLVCVADSLICAMAPNACSGVSQVYG